MPSYFRGISKGILLDIGRAILVAIGIITLLIAIAVVSCTWIASSGDTYELKGSYSSPDGSHLLAVGLSMGGGAAGRCSRHLLIMPSQIQFDGRKVQEEYQVGMLGCGGEIKIQWESETLVHVLVVLSEPWDQIGSGYLLGTHDRSGKVKVDYRFGAM